MRTLTLRLRAKFELLTICGGGTVLMFGIYIQGFYTKERAYGNFTVLQKGESKRGTKGMKAIMMG